MPARPFFMGRPGWVRSRAWIWLLFVDAQDQSLVRRIEVEPDHVLHLGGKVPVARNFESLDQMRFQSVRLLYPLHTAAGGVFRSRTNRSNRSRSAALIEICSIFLIRADSHVCATL